MTETQTNIFDQHEERPKGGTPYVKDGQIINTDDVTAQETVTFQFENKDVVRKQYTFKDGTKLVVPMSLHWEIKDLRKEYGAKLHAIKVRITGEGKLKKYQAMLQL